MLTRISTRLLLCSLNSRSDPGSLCRRGPRWVALLAPCTARLFRPLPSRHGSRLTVPTCQRRLSQVRPPLAPYRMRPEARRHHRQHPPCRTPMASYLRTSARMTPRANTPSPGATIAMPSTPRRSPSSPEAPWARCSSLSLHLVHPALTMAARRSHRLTLRTAGISPRALRRVTARLAHMAWPGRAPATPSLPTTPRLAGITPVCSKRRRLAPATPRKASPRTLLLIFQTSRRLHRARPANLATCLSTATRPRCLRSQTRASRRAGRRGVQPWTPTATNKNGVLSG
jgi:hypothetical protein